MKPEDFAINFLKYFTSHIPPSILKEYNIGAKKRDFLWNLFAARLVPCYVGDEARQEYDKVSKINAEEIQYNFFGQNNSCSKKLSNSLMKSAEIDKSGLMEFYVFDKDFSWVYVVTHELDSCGPYFCYKPIC